MWYNCDKYQWSYTRPNQVTLGHSKRSKERKGQSNIIYCFELYKKMSVFSTLSLNQNSNFFQKSPLNMKAENGQNKG
jgi:hypothetical protein